MLHLIRIPWQALLDGLLACWLLSGALFWFVSRRGGNRPGAMGRLLLSVAAYAAAFAIWLAWGGTSAGYPWLVGVAMVVQVAALESLMRGWGRSPRYYSWLYALAIAAGGSLVLLWHPIDPPNLHAAVAAFLPGRVLLAVNLGGSVAFLVLSAAYGRRRAWLGVVLALLVAGLNLHDLLFAVPARMTFSWLAVGAVLLLPVSWLTVRASMSAATDLALEAQIMDRGAGLRRGQAVLDGEAAGVLYCYLAGHRPLVDSLGAEVGDRVLERAALEVGRVCRQGDVLMRWERGAFLVVYPGILFGDERTLQARVLSVLSQMRVSFDGRPVPVDVEARLGWGWGDRGASFMDVVSAAGRAMAEGSRAGGRGSVS